jgi:hypothetical protein
MSRINFETCALAACQRAHAAEKAARDEAVLAGSLLRTIQASQTGGPSRTSKSNAKTKPLTAQCGNPGLEIANCDLGEGDPTGKIVNCGVELILHGVELTLQGAQLLS